MSFTAADDNYEPPSADAQPNVAAEHVHGEIKTQDQKELEFDEMIADRSPKPGVTLRFAEIVCLLLIVGFCLFLGVCHTNYGVCDSVYGTSSGNSSAT